MARGIRFEYITFFYPLDLGQRGLGFCGATADPVIESRRSNDESNLAGGPLLSDQFAGPRQTPPIGDRVVGDADFSFFLPYDDRLTCE